MSKGKFKGKNLQSPLKETFSIGCVLFERSHRVECRDCNMISGHYYGVCIVVTRISGHVLTDVQTETLPQTEKHYSLFFVLQFADTMGARQSGIYITNKSDRYTLCNPR